jgi:hypothetical protein
MHVQSGETCASTTQPLAALPGACPKDPPPPHTIYLMMTRYFRQFGVACPPRSYFAGVLGPPPLGWPVDSRLALANREVANAVDDKA